MVKVVSVSSICQISLCTLGCLYGTGKPVLAQVTSDRTVNTEVNTNGKTAEITGGETRGDNLFHSFRDFSVGAGDEAFFNNANDIANIFSRVTGGNISNINGLIRSNGSANLFLINPAGILFGEGARLELGGSFYGSTADSILFEDGEFSATDLETPPVLTINAPIGLQFRETAGAVEVQGTGNSLAFDLTTLSFVPGETPPGLQVQPGETLALVGKGMKLTGGNLFADGGRIEVGSINSPSLVKLIPKSGNWTLDYADVSSFQDIELSNRASVDVSSNLGAGSLQIQGRNVNLDGGSAIFSFTGSQPGGTIQVNATDTLSVIGVSANNQVTSTIYTAASLNGTAKGGDLAIATDKLIARGGAQIGADTYGKGSAGIINVQAKESVLLSGTFPDNDIVPTALGTFVQPGATGSSSQLNLTTQRLTIADGGQLITATIGDGSAATLTANVAFLTELTGTGSAISSSVPLIPDLPAPTGDGGKINLTTGQLKISDEAKITVSNQGLGDAGDIQVISSNIGLSDRAQIIAETAAGAGGNINLQIDDTLTMSDNSLISAQAFNRANGGNINIDSNFIVARPNQIDGDGSDIIASAAAGDGGRITINAESLLGIEARKAVANNRTNEIDASSEFGLDGTVSIFASDLNPVQGVTELPSKVVETEQSTAQACAASRDATVASGLAIAGKGGVTPTPNAPLNSENIMVNVQNATSTIPQPIETSQGKIQPAMGIKVTKSGKIVLTAYRTNNAGERIPDIKLNCNHL